MRKLMTAALLAIPFAAGCTQVGGICDCAPGPGDSIGYNPHVTYHATCPWCDVPPPAPVATSTAANDGGSTEPVTVTRMPPKAK